ncbi:50S ribosomal protein L23 [Halanaerobium saccharolyticum]|jgi:large subunit ribosomal protein L23|uniref:Large ribosomal subunit protein uL23 n=1 Tax=Halanaerobium saccharolyticum TaxID=43595 RepID=A0A2T5RM86_9FIRM|nr:50S ribosomal protein L23 [Halanaerobium saccharolyticum]PTW00480.1 LSU ribosomal protein L23P [Halanaerobium saccharolyticum]PUU94385.1 MAG: large subunit ribosomal protein L23 [Halanaerobium sp.]TDQ06004.1 LSU ribosomal protein L23P [Halanaerobium saccharolyticum]
MKDARDIIIAPIISENTMDQMQEANTYTFKVAKNANKVEIRNAVEEIFSVNVINVNTMNVRGKKRRLGFHVGKKPDWKKALVKLAEGDEIEIYEGL